MNHVIVIPCYNEASRFKAQEFIRFAHDNSDFTLCFVNDGSKDNTLEVLHCAQSESPSNIRVLNMTVNQGKAEAVRAGFKYMMHQPCKSIGFIDADLATSFEEYTGLVQNLQTSKGGTKMVFGSRKAEPAEGVKRSAFRTFASDAVGLAIRSILAMPIADTQCGAKVFSPDLAAYCFQSNFITKWLFDVEIFLRARKCLGGKSVMRCLSEVQLKEWVEVDGSKLTLKDSVKMPLQLARIVMGYHVAPVVSQAPRTLQVAGTRLMTSLNLL